MATRRFHFCPKCGARLTVREHGGRQRAVCERCSYILYENPIVGVAGIVIDKRKILLGKRVDARFPGWCIPCGYVEWDEEIREALAREFREETGLEIAPTRVYNVHSNFHNPQQHTVGVWFLAEVRGGLLQPSDDVQEVGWFNTQYLPPLAFPTDRLILEQLEREGLID